MFVSALVMAAGASARMQPAHKLLLPWRGKPLIAHTIDHLLQTQVAETIVVLGHCAAQIQIALREGHMRFVLNEHYADGLSTSIKAGVAALSPRAEAILICLGDLPLVKANEIDHLLKRFAKSSHATIAVPTYKGRRGHPVLFDIRYRDAMSKLSGDVGCKAIIKQYEQEVLEVEMPSDHVLRDVDTIEAYEKLILTV